MFKYLIPLFFLALTFQAFSQSEAYASDKAKKLAVKSPFEKIWDEELPAEVVYKDSEIIAFVPLRRQTPVHFLIVPKKRIPTIADLEDADIHLIGKMYKVARDLAKEYNIAETGYRLSMNTNEDSGQSVFHIHLHLLGGMKVGPMVTQTYVDPRKKKEDK
ncbi:MAG: histidine triad nucleotide-binding protein [Roseivirga sp.]